MADTFTCERCHGTFTKAWTDAEATAEAVATFTEEELTEQAVICDPCYREFMAALPALRVPTERYTWGGDERDRMDFTIPDPPGLPATIPNLSDYVASINIDASRFNAAMLRAAHHLHRIIVGFQLPAERREHRRHCPVCNPRGYPKPLKVNGADYQRRRNNRRKRA